jgi:hypothetical protein
MATQISTTGARSQPAPRLGVLQVALVALIAAAVIVIGVGAWIQAGSTGDGTIESRAYGGGYPLHNGLAGPSRVGQTSTVDASSHFGPGYPPHGGLAGPSRVDSVD